MIGVNWKLQHQKKPLSTTTVNALDKFNAMVLFNKKGRSGLSTLSHNMKKYGSDLNSQTTNR